MKANSNAIETLKSVIREPYAWPGGYPRYLITNDGAALCHRCAKSEYRNILDSTRKSMRDGWQIEGADVNWEDPALYCDHCGQQIESAYGED